MSDQLILVAVVLARLGIPLLMGRFPLPAVAACLVIDAADQSIFQLFTDLDLTGYQTYDKALDIYYLTLVYLSTIRNWGGGPGFRTAQALWYYRLVGVTIFEYTSARWVLFVFANTFEYFFIAIEAYKVKRDPSRLPARQIYALAAFIWVFIKLPQEWWIHIAQLDFTDFAKEQVFGVDPDSSWWTAITNRPLVSLAIVAALVLLVAAIRVAARRLPPASWPATFDADRQGSYLGWRAPRREARPRAYFGWPFVEKVVLVSLVSFIFARMLPGADARLITMALITTYLIAVNTVLSQWLARRGTSWRSTAVELVWMGLANAAVVGVTAVVVGAGSGSTPLGTTLFLVGLLTLIVVLYDRVHGTFVDRRREGWAGRGEGSRNGTISPVET